MAVAQQRSGREQALTGVGVALPTRKARSLWSDAWHRLLRNKAAVLGMMIIGFFFLCGITAPWLAPHDPIKTFPNFSQNAPVWVTGDDRFLLGNDMLGRDLLSRLIWGARISMIIGIIPVTINLLFGGTIGIVSGYSGGNLDNALMRLTDVVYAFPDLLLLLLVSATFHDTPFAYFGAGLPLLFITISIVSWAGMARLVRGQVLSVKEKEYIEAARCIGVPTPKLLWRHVVPNVLAPVLVAIAFGVPGAIFAEAGLSYLGLGVKPPTATWGSMIQDGFSSINTQPIMVIAPGVCIAVVLLAFTFLGDGLRDALDPRMKQ